FSVSGGNLVPTPTAANFVVGIPYTGTFKSSKLAYAAGVGTALTQKKKVSQVGLILRNTHKDGLQFGTDLNALARLPSYEDGQAVADDYIWTEYDKASIPISSSWGSDERFFLVATAPRPVTVLAAVPTIVTHDKS
ncbi:MAG TPA: hypothetical protein DCZ12_15910, partial [Gammaproteobacteria bacterium]|nr:hypothetical protein [Gammaproteobacteria bacterium]